MHGKIKISDEDFFKNPIDPQTFVLFNPPYGERLSINKNNFYEEIGSTLKHHYRDCIVWIISSDIENMKYIGLKPSKRINIKNGNLECSFRKFEIYKGSKKKKN